MINNIKIAHFILDEKFPDSAYDQFEAVCRGCSKYYIVSKNKKLNHLKKIKPIFISRFSFLSKGFIDSLLGMDLVILHSLTTFNSEVVLRLSGYKEKPIIVWIGMGYDYYNVIYPNGKGLLLNSTALIENTMNSRKENLKGSIIKNIKTAIKKRLYRSFDRESVFKGIDYFSPVVPKEYDMVKDASHYKQFPKYISWNYAVNAHLIDSSDKLLVDRTSNNILLGNSATYTNNHLEIIDFLSENYSYFHSVLCPLSYGDNAYKSYIRDYGKKALHEKFETLEGFINYEDYIEKIQRCAVVIMNHKRQQAGANISAMLRMGATVFLREESPFFDFYKSQGVTLFSIQDLEKNPNLLNYRLNDSEIECNVNVLRYNRGWSVSLERTKKIIELVSAKK